MSKKNYSLAAVILISHYQSRGVVNVCRK